MIVDSVRYTGYPAGPTVTHTYVISGTLKSIVEKMAKLYQMRDSIPRPADGCETRTLARTDLSSQVTCYMIISHS